MKKAIQRCVSVFLSLARGPGACVMSLRRKSAVTSVQQMHDKALAAELELLEGFAGRPATEAEAALLAVDENGRHPAQPLSYAKVCVRLPPCVVFPSISRCGRCGSSFASSRCATRGAWRGCCA